MWFLTFHGVMYWALWINQGTWVEEALERGPGHNNLSGGLAFIFGVLLWLSALQVVRRSNYSVFKVLHHIGFWGFMVGGVCHYWSNIWYFIPGMVFYGIDAVFRIHQAVFERSSVSGTRSMKVLQATVSSDGMVCSLLLQQSQLAAAECGTLWLCVPELSWFGWHPFDYLAVPQVTPGESQQALLVSIKAYDRWTQRLVSLIAEKGADIRVKIQGPYAEGGARAAPADGVVIVAGEVDCEVSYSTLQFVYGI